MADAKVTAFNKPLTPSPALAAVIGAEPLARTEAVKKLWVYIKANGLQNEQNKREIKADAKLEAALGKGTFDMFEMNKLLSPQLKAA